MPGRRPISVGALRFGFAGAAMLVLALSLWPITEPMPLHTGWDKTDHVAAFAVLGLLGLRAWAHARARMIVGLVLYGGLIEVLQSFTIHRQADWRDVVADVVGIGLAVLILAAWRRRRR